MQTTMNWRRLASLLLVLVVGPVACDRQDDRSADAAVDETELPGPGEVSYDVDTLAFVREQRPVIFNDREWWPQPEPIHDPLVTPVGTFEGAVLYTNADETLPFGRLLIPAGGSRWLILLPTSRLPRGAETEAAGQ